MKCINCGTDNNLKDRTANYGRCKQCHHPFVFEPTSTENKAKITDQFFKKLLDDISVGGTIAYTPKQLHYFLDRRVKHKVSVSSISWLIIYLFAGGFLGIFLAFILVKIFTHFNLSLAVGILIVNIIFIRLLYFHGLDRYRSQNAKQGSNRALLYLGWLMLLPETLLVGLFTGNLLVTAAITVSGIAGIGLSAKQKKHSEYLSENFCVEPSQVAQGIAKWVNTNGAIERLLPPPHRVAIAGVQDQDVTAYSFDRLIVTDTDSIAHFLIANNFHFENNCAILSINEYPQPIFETVMEMVRRNPDLQVYAIHNCSPEGVSLVHQIRRSDRWFGDGTIQMIDLGLLPRQVMTATSNLFIQNSEEARRRATGLSDVVRQSLTSDELAWIDAGNLVELESFPPRRLLQIIHQGINRSRDLANGDDGGGMILVDNYGSDPTAIYAVDSFG